MTQLKNLWHSLTNALSPAATGRARATGVVGMTGGTPQTTPARKTAHHSRARSVQMFEQLEARQMLSTVLNVGTATDVTNRNGYETDPSVLVSRLNTSNMFAVSDITTAGILTQFSTNGGATWTSKVIATGQTNVDTLPRGLGDTVAATDNFGNLFVAYTSNSGVFQTVVLLLSTDFGQTFSMVAQNQGYALPKLNVGGGDKPGMQTVSLVFTGSDGQIYATAARTSGLGSFSGLTTPQPIDGSRGASFSDAAIDNNGRVSVSFQMLNNGQIFTAFDPDGAGSQGFGAPILATTTAVVPGFAVPAQSRGLSASPSLGYDDNGRLFIAYVDVINPGISDTDIFLRFSDDNGATWSAATKVNDDTTNFAQFMPELAVDPTTGNIAVAFYDARNSTDNTTVQIFAAVSTDGGLTFMPNVQVSGPGSTNASNIIGNRDQGGQLGDYISLQFYDNRIQAGWTDNSTITKSSNPLYPFDIFTNSVTLTQSDAPGTPTLTSINVLNGFVVENGFAVVDYSTLLSASDAADPQGLALSFEITSIAAGTTVQINGQAAAVGDTFGYGDAVSWVAPADTSGVVDAFGVVVTNGTNESAAPVTVQFDVLAPVPGDAPVIQEVDSTRPVLVVAGQTITLSIGELGPASSQPARIEYYFDANNNNVWDAGDTFLGESFSVLDGYSLDVGTAGLSLGQDRDFFAVGYGAAGSQSNIASIEIDVLRSINISPLYGGSSVQYTDSNGNLISVRLAGAGYGQVLFDTNATNADPVLINLQETNISSGFYLFTRNNVLTNIGGLVVGNLEVIGDPDVFFGKIAGNLNLLVSNPALVSIGTVNLANVTLTGGPLIITGGTRLITLNNVTDSDIYIGRYAVSATTNLIANVRLQTVTDTSLYSLTAISTLSSSGWLDTDGTPDVIQPVAISVLNNTGDLNANLNFAPSNAIVRVSSIVINGNVTGGTWTIRGNTNAVNIYKNTDPSWTLNMLGEASNTGILSSLIIRGNASGTITAQSVYNMQVQGSMIDLDMRLFQPTISGNTSLGGIRSLSVTNDIIDSSIIANGSVGNITTRSMIDTLITAGLNPGAGLPTSRANFISTLPSVGVVTIRGATGIANAFVGSTIVGYKINGFSTPTLDVDNLGVEFGLFAASIGNVSILAPAPGVRLNNLIVPLINERPLGGDFILRIVAI